MATKNTQLIEAIFTLSRLTKEEMSFNSDLATLSVLQIQALNFIKKNPQTPMTQIAEKFAIELPSATSLIGKLIKAKLVIRSTDKKDRRRVLVSLTEKGVLLLADAMKQRTKRLEDTLSFLSEKDTDELVRIFNTLIAHLDKKNEK